MRIYELTWLALDPFQPLPSFTEISGSYMPKHLESQFGVLDLDDCPEFQPERFASYFVYEYQHIDYLDLMPPASLALRKYPNVRQIITEVGRRFLDAGWEGDGVIQLLWLPPFLGIADEGTWGTFLFHVKQGQKGRSYLASPVRLNYREDGLWASLLDPEAAPAPSSDSPHTA